MRRGQAALEFLSTYSWALFGILVVVGVLAYFGLFSPTQYVPESCYFGAQLVCEDFAIERVSEDQTQISMNLRNNFERAIQVVDIEPLDSSHTISGCTSKIEIDRRGSMMVRCIVEANLEVGRKTSFALNITFNDNETLNSPNHSVMGEVFAKVPTDIRTSPLLQCSDDVNNDPGSNSCDDMEDSGCSSPDDPTEAGGDCNIGNPAAPLSCVVSSACQQDFTEVLRLSDYTDAHAELAGGTNFAKKVCCHAAARDLSTACGQAVPMRLTDVTDAHAGTGALPHNVCLSANPGTMECTPRTVPAICLLDEICLARLSDITEGHVSDCTTNFQTAICCKVT